MNRTECKNTPVCAEDGCDPALYGPPRHPSTPGAPSSRGGNKNCASTRNPNPSPPIAFTLMMTRLALGTSSRVKPFCCWAPPFESSASLRGVGIGFCPGRLAGFHSVKPEPAERWKQSECRPANSTRPEHRATNPRNRQCACRTRDQFMHPPGPRLGASGAINPRSTRTAHSR